MIGCYILHTKECPYLTQNQTMLSEKPCVLNHNFSNLITVSILSSKQAVELNLREMLPVSSQSQFIFVATLLAKWILAE